MGRIFENITETVGNTPLVRLSHLGEGLPGSVLVKLESFNPMGSVKDRIAVYILRKAVAQGELRKGDSIIESSSGNTGIALAMAAAVGGFHLVLTMPESMTVERRRILSALGAELRLTPAELGMKGAIAEAERLHAEHADWFRPLQFSNPANPEIHANTTAREIWLDTSGQIDVFVAGVGTGGTVSGTGSVLKQKRPGLRVVAVEPQASPVISGGEPGPHGIQGIGAGFIPDNLDRDLIDEVLTVSEEDARRCTRELARREGILGGISSGANVWAALRVAAREKSRGKLIVTLVCDTGERYLSTELFAEGPLGKAQDASFRQ